MNIDKQTVEDIRFLLRQIIDCPAQTPDTRSLAQRRKYQHL